MLGSIWRFLFPTGQGDFEEYYQRVLQQAGETTAPSIYEARRDYLRSLRSRRGY
ncbi:MAG: hypothetical protein M1401_02415 [Chloroflexi bacterium]|nr:hypothetical protein [Chloroflexota bacterium]MCL5107728.1 hypothetical protein [Chloroflexota bacterium]